MWLSTYKLGLTTTRSDICFVVNTQSQYLVKPRWVHLIVANHVMRYLKGTIYFGLYYDRDNDYILYGYIDSYWEGSVTDRKGTSSGWYYLGSSMISWMNKKQSIVALSMIEAEYIASCYASWEVIWLQKLMSGIFELDLDTTVILCDN